jgi:streptogramin lyase
MTVVLVSNYSGDSITEYDLATGNYLGVFATTAAHPYSMTYDNNGFVYVALSDKSIHKYNLGGADLGSIATMGSSDNMLTYHSGFLYESGYNNGIVRKMGLDGTDFGTFATLDSNGLQGMAWDAAGNLLVNDYNGATYGGTIRKVAPDGTVLGQFATLGGAGYSPLGIAVDPSGNVYASDWAQQNIRKFDSSGADVLTFAAGKGVYAVAMGTNNTLLATSSGDSAILMYGTDGSYQGVFASTGINGATGIIMVPEPGINALLTTGALALSVWRRKRRK